MPCQGEKSEIKLNKKPSWIRLVSGQRRIWSFNFALLFCNGRPSPSDLLRNLRTIINVHSYGSAHQSLFSDEVVAVAVAQCFLNTLNQAKHNQWDLLGNKFINFGVEPSYTKSKALAGTKRKWKDCRTACKTNMTPAVLVVTVAKHGPCS